MKKTTLTPAKIFLPLQAKNPNLKSLKNID